MIITFDKNKKMKTKILILFAAINFIFACNNTQKNHTENSGHEEHDEHLQKGMVKLNQKQEEALGLKLGMFEMRNLTTVIKTNGQLEVPPSGTADITALMGGNVRKIKVFHGDKVKKGQILAILEHPDFITIQEEYSNVLHNLNFLEQDYKRQKELFENNAGAGKDYQKAKSVYNIAKSKLNAIKSRLSLMHISAENVEQGNITNRIAIYSPLNGYVTEINIKLGTYVEPKDKMFEITDNSEIHADFMVYEKDVDLIEKGQKVHFNVSNRTEDEHLATIFAVGKEFDDKTRSIHIHAKIDKSNDKLLPGMYVTGHIHTDKRMTKTLPDDAIVTEGTKSYVFILNDNDHEEEGHSEMKHEHDADEHAEHNHGDHDDEHDKQMHNEGEHSKMEHEHDADEHAEHNHGDHDDHDDHIHKEKDHEVEKHSESNDSRIFKMIEIIKGQQDNGYTEVKLIEELPEDTQFVLNAAYYLLADMKKEETEHHH